MQSSSNVVDRHASRGGTGFCAFPDKEMNRVTLVFSSHRPETLHLASRAMRCHDAIFLEEPPTPPFHPMLKGDVAIEDYLLERDIEFPEFSYRTCELFRDLKKEGKALYQVEPFLDVLGGIHEFFAEGGTFRDFDPHSTQFQVYQAEKRATGALLNYYQTVLKGSFEATIEALKQFARADAARIALRDKMRARALKPLLPSFPSAYVEAGYIHYALWRELRKRLPARVHLKPVFLMAPVVKPILGKRQALGPGDILTLLYVFHPDIQGERLDLLAARSLVYVKLLEKEEMTEEAGPYPHTRNEVETIEKVEGLSFDDCRTLFPEIRLVKTKKARSIVEAFLSTSIKPISDG